jgi:hypothetical protein
MEPLDLAIQLSDLFEAAKAEGSEVACLIDKEIIPYLRSHLKEADGIGLGQRFAKILDRVQMIVNQSGADEVRALKKMMQGVLADFVKRTKDAVTGRHIFHNAIMKGKDAMLTVTAAGLLANALAGQHPREAMQMMQQVGSRLTGEHPMAENSSAGAVAAGSIATVVNPKKRRKNSIFAEIERNVSLQWKDLQDQPATLDQLREIANGTENRQIESVLVDPTTAELVLATHIALNPEKKRRYEAKPVSEMIRIAYRLLERGGIEVIMEES